MTQQKLVAVPLIVEEPSRPAAGPQDQAQLREKESSAAALEEEVRAWRTRFSSYAYNQSTGCVEVAWQKDISREHNWHKGG